MRKSSIAHFFTRPFLKSMAALDFNSSEKRADRLPVLHVNSNL